MKNPILENLLLTNVDNLKQKQFDALKQHGIDVLMKIVDHLRKNNLDEIEAMTFYSPAGDDMGCDNNCINFEWTDTKDTTDIMDLLNQLRHLS